MTSKMTWGLPNFLRDTVDSFPEGKGGGRGAKAIIARTWSVVRLRMREALPPRLTAVKSVINPHQPCVK
jgi:hypothetical protein